MSDERDRVDWLAALVTGYNHYPETFGDDWPRELAESLACHLWPWSKRQRVPDPAEKTCPRCGRGPMELWMAHMGLSPTPANTPKHRKPE